MNRDDVLVLLVAHRREPGVPRGWIAWKGNSAGKPNLPPRTRISVMLASDIKNDREFTEGNNNREFEEYSWYTNGSGSIMYYKVLK